MLSDNTTRWTVRVSTKTDRAVRTLLARRGMKKGDLSKFIEEAVKWRVLDQTLIEVRSGFEDLQPDDLKALIDEATDSVRSEVRRELTSARYRDT